MNLLGTHISHLKCLKSQKPPVRIPPQTSARRGDGDPGPDRRGRAVPDGHAPEAPGGSLFPSGRRFSRWISASPSGHSVMFGGIWGALSV